MMFMLREEAKHLRSGEQGFERILRAGEDPGRGDAALRQPLRPARLRPPRRRALDERAHLLQPRAQGLLPLDRRLPRRSRRASPSTRTSSRTLLAREKDPVRYSYKFIDLNLGGSVNDVNKELLNGITVTFYKRTLEKHFEKFNKIIAESYPKGTKPLVLPSLRWNRAAALDVRRRDTGTFTGSRSPRARSSRPTARPTSPRPRTSRIATRCSPEEGGIAPPEADVYKELTKRSPRTRSSSGRRFGTKAKSRYTTTLSHAAAPPAIAAAPGRRGQAAPVAPRRGDPALAAHGGGRRLSR